MRRGAELALGEWRTIKMPFTAFRDARFYAFAEEVRHVYLLLRDDTPGPFALELGAIVAGRCEHACLPSAGFVGKRRCEIGHCGCGYYNGLRVEGFEGPLAPPRRGGGFPGGALERGFASHHADVVKDDY